MDPRFRGDDGNMRVLAAAGVNVTRIGMGGRAPATYSKPE